MGWNGSRVALAAIARTFGLPGEAAPTAARTHSVASDPGNDQLSVEEWRRTGRDIMRDIRNRRYGLTLASAAILATTMSPGAVIARDGINAPIQTAQQSPSEADLAAFKRAA
jgi:hypothetical protein